MCAARVISETAPDERGFLFECEGCRRAVSRETPPYHKKARLCKVYVRREINFWIQHLQTWQNGNSNYS